MKPLSGLRVLDLSRILSGPFCTMILGDLGADVIKVEPLGGDDTRKWGPPFVNGESAYFLSVNRNKRSIAVNLKSDEGKELFRTLVGRSDVLVENFRPGTLARLGMDYPRLREINPRLILVSISGFGQTGPYRDRPGYDLIAQGMSGLMSITGEPGGAPSKIGFSMADVAAGLWAVIGILAALRARERTGEGDWLDLSLLEALVACQTYLAGNYFASGRDPQPLGTAHPNAVPYQMFEAQDGYVNVAVGNDGLWEAFCRCVDPGLLADARFQTNEGRVKFREVLIPRLAEIFRRDTVQHWVSRLLEHGVPAGPVYTFSQLYQDPHLRERGMVLEVLHETAGNVRMVGLPIHFGRQEIQRPAAAPLLGEHTIQILKECGYSDEAIDRLVKRRIVHAPQRAATSWDSRSERKEGAG
ncbi:MAG: CoA transferase [Kyrpidia sp.]|nr:CoA transferase [Kyrpidia sp.]